MLDINFIRDNKDVVKQSIKKRGERFDQNFVDELLKVDKEWRELKGKVDFLRKERNELTLQITKLSKQGKDISKLVVKAKSLPDEIKKSEAKLDELKKKMDLYLLRIPNVLHKSVPEGKDARDNKFVKAIGKTKKFNFELKSHVEIAESSCLADFEQGREVSGQGFNYLNNELAMLDLALQRYGIDFLLKRKFILIVPPMLLRKSALSGAVDLSVFQDVIYKIENEDLYLIGTAEHSLVSMFKDKLFNKLEKPIKVCAVTPCFRKEIGAHGVDTKGLFRMHQFNKVEQVIVCREEDSFKILEEMEKITEQFFKSLGVPFRVVELCSGDLGAKFAKQYDIEAWFPRQCEYKEVTSAGNCTNYQAVALNVKYMDKDKKKYVHMLNNTMVATSRAMVAILENFQQKDGSVVVPKVLRQYMNGISVIGKKKK